MTLRLYTLILCTAIGLSGLSAHADQGQRPAAAPRTGGIRRSVSRIEVPQHRPRDDGRPHRRSRGARVEPRGLLRRHRHRRPVEDDEQRHDLGSAVRRSRRHRVDRRHRDQSRTTPTRCGSAAARTTTARAARGATASTSRSTAARRGSTWASAPRSTSRASSSIRSITTSSTSRRSAACGDAAASAASTRPPTAA